ncbi:unnamed protein product [Gongylonema pulchrum]|uniref:Myosin_tail_1 domain-containing protein n=1 Tax=Gongylonema pulchrum TaxID=637853 RepID=A0A183DDQ9_9BILA|nr:unnamed protein product [Gongylonema pulchrum]
MEHELLECQKELEENRAEFGSVKLERDKLLLDKDKLQSELNELRQGAREQDDGCESSQADSSESNISLLSDRGMEIERLRATVYQQSIDEEKIRTKLEAEIAQLQAEMKQREEDNQRKLEEMTQVGEKPKK